MEDLFAATANLLAEPTRAKMLLKLLSGRALPAGELASAANVSPQTASEHLRRLTEGRMVCMEQQGRHRYYRLAGTDVADALEALLVLMPGAQGHTTMPPEAGTVAHARTCYAHLAGWLGVRVADALLGQGLLVAAERRQFAVTDAGRLWLAGMDIAVPSVCGPDFAKRCPDWTERRPHVAGTLGLRLYRRMAELKWIAPVKGSRCVRVTLEGRRRLWAQLRVAC